MKFEEWFKYQLMDRDETTPEMKLAKSWSACAWYHHIVTGKQIGRAHV